MRPGAALAHGEPPEVMGIVSADAIGPVVVKLNEGLAFRDGDHFTFLCPSLWGDRDTTGARALHALGDDSAAYVVGADALYTVEEGALIAQPHAAVDASSVVALAASDGGVFALLFTTEGSELVPLHHDAAPLWQTSELWPALAAREDRLLLARPVPEGGVEVRVLDEAGALIAEGHAAIPDEVLALRLRAPGGAGEPIYLGFSDGSQQVLGEVSLDDFVWRERARSDESLHGPVELPGGASFIADGGQLMELTPAGPVAVADAVGVTCLQRWRSTVYACTGTSLRALEPGGLGDTLFELQGLHALGDARTPDSADPACRFQWQLFENDLTRSGLAPVAADTGDDAQDMAAGGAAGGGAGAAMEETTPRATDAPSNATTASDGAAGSGGGCTVRRARDSDSSALRSLLVLCAFALLLRRRRGRSRA